MAHPMNRVMKTLALLAASALATPATAQTRTQALSGPTFQSAIVRMHDVERAQVGVGPIEWDEGLARDAAEWAAHLADENDLVHWIEENDGDNEQGENLWMGTRGGYSLAQMVGGWSEEKVPLRRMASWEDDYETVGHYTQMVWRDTRKVGCAVSSNRENEILVCRYWPAGNVMGEQPYEPRRSMANTQMASLP